jgi:hypothetical protein
MTVPESPEGIDPSWRRRFFLRISAVSFLCWSRSRVVKVVADGM